MDKHLAFNTLNAIRLFSDQLPEIKKASLIFHIPHSSVEIPDGTGYTSEELLLHEIELTTDFYTNEIFNVPDTTKLIAEFSRVFCDVERLKDSDEPQSKVGKGYFYTKTDSGHQLRNITNRNKLNVYGNYYIKHHKTLKALVKSKLSKFETATIIDCHSFNNMPLKQDHDQSIDRPDICLGIDNYHTPIGLIDKCVSHFTGLGYSVKINSPYSGTIIPLNYYLKNQNVFSIMIEINKDLYMKNNMKDILAIGKLNREIVYLFENFK